MIEKSERTPVVSTQHNPLGEQGLWHTPSKKVPEKQQLPALERLHSKHRPRTYERSRHGRVSGYRDCD